VQVLPPQQGNPSDPHTAQTTPFLQIRPASLHVLLAQQELPAVPHAAQSPLVQIRPTSLHVLLAQQRLPGFPHVLQVLEVLSQMAPASSHACTLPVVVEQQA
jgi:hypothetical protein